VGPQGCRQGSRPPTPPQSTRQIHPGRAAHDPEGCTNERVRAYTCAGNLGLQTTVIPSAKCILDAGSLQECLRECGM